MTISCHHILEQLISTFPYHPLLLEMAIFRFLLQKATMDISHSRQVINALREDPFLNNRYEFIDLIGEGCFGKILKVRSKGSRDVIALKLQKFRKVKLKMVLRNEIEVLSRLQGKYGVPKLLNHGEWVNGSYLQMELLQKDLNCGKKYSLVEIMELTLELIKILSGIHDSQILHQDLKPHNIMLSKSNHLFIIDFGLARPVTLKKHHYTMRGFIGTPRYASVRAHNMLEQSKKDDLESLFYNIAYLYYQKLPWSKLNVSNDKKLDKIKLLKVQHRDSLFKQMALPFQRAFDYITNLDPYEEPNYSLLKGYFKRNKTLLMEPNFDIFSTKTTRSNVKKVSMNNSNFLQVPDQNPRRKSPVKQEQGWGWGNSSKTSSNGSIGLFSDAILSHLFEFDVASHSQSGKNRSPRKVANQDFGSEENIEPKLPDVTNFSRNLVMKNPFS